MVRRGTLGTSLVAAGSISPAFLPADTFELPASPLIERFGLEWLGTGAGRVLTTILLAVGMALLVDAWLRMRPVHGRRAPSLAWLLWSLPIMLAPPLFSRDAYSYAAQGQIVLRGMDPYAVGPFWVPGPFADQVDPMWVQTPAPYGPLALQVQHLVVSVFPENAYVSAVAMRVPALLAVGLLAYALPRLAERYGVSGRHALWLGVLNPLVIMHFIGGAHGDAVMVALVTLALLLASRGQLRRRADDDRGRRRLQADGRPRPHRRRRHGAAGPERPRTRRPRPPPGHGPARPSPTAGSPWRPSPPSPP